MSARKERPPEFRVSGGTLIVKGELQDELQDEFRDCFAKLLASDSEELVLDLSGVNYARSCHLSMAMNLFLDAQGRGKTLRTKASPKVAKLFDMVGLCDVLNLEVVT